MLRFKSWLKWVLVSSRLTPPWFCFLHCEMGMMVTWLLRRLNVLTKGSGQSHHPLSIGPSYCTFQVYTCLSSSTSSTLYYQTVTRIARQGIKATVQLKDQARHNHISSSSLASSRTKLLSFHNSSNVFM